MKCTTGLTCRTRRNHNFVSCLGRMEMIDPNGSNMIFFKEGDVILIPDGWFHRVHAGPFGTYFVCIFDGKRKH